MYMEIYTTTQFNIIVIIVIVITMTVRYMF